MNRLLLIVPILLLFNIQSSKACIDPDSLINVHVNYDTVFISPCPYVDQIEIRLSNLRMMNESPNKICACALASFSDLFTNLEYVAFVDSGTNNPYNGFDEFLNQAAYDAAWDASQPGFGGWEGFISDVINGGLNADDPLEMVIRASTASNTLILVDSNCSGPLLLEKLSQSSLGTDAWDPIEGDLDQSHQEVRNLGTATLSMVNSSYFTALDDAILNNYPSDTNTCSANFSFVSSGLSVTLTDMSNMNANQYVIVDWGDGESDSIMSNQSVTHEYAAGAHYDVCVQNVNNGSTACSRCENVIAVPLGVESGSTWKAVRAFPNPASDVLQITIDGKQASNETIDLVNPLGKVISSTTNASMDVSTVPDGVYFIHARQNGEVRKSSAIIVRH